MRVFGIAVAVAVASVVSAPALAQTRPAAAVETMPWQLIERIVAGNVIDVRGVGAVRLAGIDDGGELSRAFLAGIISSQPVRVVPTAHSSDGLTHALVYTPDGRCVNAEMLRFGYARVSDTQGFDRIAEFRGLQEDAQRLKRGLWGVQPVARAVVTQPAAPRESSTRRFHVAAGGGATLSGGRRDWIGAFETGAAITRVLGLYFSAGYLHDFGDTRTAGAERAWHGSAGMRFTAPAQLPIRPYLRAGGGYIRIESDRGDVQRRDEPFWEAGAGVLAAGGPLHLDAGYTFARVGRTDVTRAFVMLGIRF